MADTGPVTFYYTVDGLVEQPAFPKEGDKLIVVLADGTTLEYVFDAPEVDPNTHEIIYQKVFPMSKAAHEYKVVQ